MIIAILLLNIFFGFFGARFMVCCAYQFGLVDLPGVRSSHTAPTPRGGGIGILLGFILTGLIVDVPLLVWLPAVILSIGSIFDDKLDLTSRLRLLLQFLASFVVVLAADWGNMGWLFYLLLLLFFVIFIVGTSNFYNFMDGINGIAGITGLVTFTLLALFAILEHLTAWQFLLPAGIAAACLGFLPLNVPRARVFMGDVGSVLLGFSFASLVCLLTYDLPSFICLISFLFMFYADALTTLFIRWRDKEKLAKAHRRHLYQIFCNELGISHWKISCVYGLIQAIIGGLMLIAYQYGLLWQFLVFGICGITFLVVTCAVRLVTRTESSVE